MAVFGVFTLFPKWYLSKTSVSRYAFSSAMPVMLAPPCNIALKVPKRDLLGAAKTASQKGRKGAMVDRFAVGCAFESEGCALRFTIFTHAVDIRISTQHLHLTALCFVLIRVRHAAPVLVRVFFPFSHSTSASSPLTHSLAPIRLITGRR